MKKSKQILAITGIVLLVLLYLSALVFALIDSPMAATMLKVSFSMTLVIPIVLYVILLLMKNNKSNSDEPTNLASDDSEPMASSSQEDGEKKMLKEQRRSERLPIELNLNISKLYKLGVISIPDLESPIEVVDISKHGIGFVSECVLPNDYLFDAKIRLVTSDHDLDVVVKIVRSQAIDRDIYMYGANFENIPDDIPEEIDKYAKTL